MPLPTPLPEPWPDPQPEPLPQPVPEPGPTPDARVRRVGRAAVHAGVLAAALVALAGSSACRGNEEEEREREEERLARVGERVAQVERLNNAAYALCRKALQGMLLLQPNGAVAGREEVRPVRRGDTIVVRGWIVNDTTSSAPQRRDWTCTIPVRDSTLNRASVRFDQ